MFLVVSVPAMKMKAIEPPVCASGCSMDTASRFRWKNRGKSSHMPTQKLTPEILTAAILGMEVQKEKLDAKIAELRAILSGGPTEPAATPEPAKRKRRKMSAAGRKAIAEAQRKRWAAAKVQAEAATPEPAKPKRRLTAAARAKLVANLKKARAAKAAKAKAAAKKSAPARKKTTATKAPVQTAPAIAAKKAAPVKKAAVRTEVEKKTAPAAAPATEAGAQ